MSLTEIDITELSINPITMIGAEWWLLTAGNVVDGCNTMTAAWGSIGAIWDRKVNNRKTILPTITVFVRPQRYTKDFIDKEELFTLSVFDSEYKKVLGYLGSHSGRDENKIEKAGLNPVFDYDTTYFEEAKMVFICRKIYRGEIKEHEFIDISIIDENYPAKDFHHMYIGEIIKVLVRE